MQDGLDVVQWCKPFSFALVKYVTVCYKIFSAGSQTEKHSFLFHLKQTPK